MSNDKVQNRERREYLKKIGKCVVCGKRSHDPGVLRCSICREKQRILNQKMMGESGSRKRLEYNEYKRQYTRNLYERRRSEGVCYKCGKPLYRDHTLCYEHYLYLKRRNHMLARKRKRGYGDIGLCRICGAQPVEGYKYCEEHLRPIQEGMLYARSFSPRGDSHCWGKDDRIIYRKHDNPHK